MTHWSVPGGVRVPTYQPRLQTRQRKGSDAPADLPAGKANLIKASHAAGMKPPAIARMFRLSQSVVNRVLNLPAKSKK